MASFSFYYRSKKDSSKVSIRLIHKNIDYTLSTPYISKREYWIYRTTKNGKPVSKHKKVEDLKGYSDIKEHKAILSEFKDKLEKQLIQDLNNGVAITKDWFKQAIIKHSNVIEGKEAILNEEIKNNKQRELELEIKRKNLLLNTVKEIQVKYQSNRDELKKFVTTYNWLNDFQNEKRIIIKTKDFNQQFVDVFKNWATIDKQYKLSTVVGHLKRIKRAVEYCYSNDTDDVIVVHKQLPYIKFTNAKERELIKDKIVVTLDFDELDLIDNLDFKNNEELREVQKSILIGCETGLRFSDFNQLVDKNLKKSIDNFEYWEFKTSKTNKWVQITKTERLQYFFKKYGLPKNTYTDNEDIVLNRNLKKVCRLAKIDVMTEGDLSLSVIINGKEQRRDVRSFYPKYKLITTRTFRRSFATNYYGKIDKELIMQVTGHTTEKILKEYIDVHDDKNIGRGFKSMAEFHENRKQPKLRKVE
ncbi:phage integrase SAM-like domain-containing protein [uncultured Polaribacter sp.]|uniref:phage integrase SAM-like domain-containing protein n=1 Tax=uncultured Polaribacter sp. TaxID=174711 RepID=UPI00260C2DD3|nr:phage integrase SAM-like domain-containing protein [uncultured Polaribacter sp.]